MRAESTSATPSDLSRADLLRLLARLPASAAGPAAERLGWWARAQPDPAAPPGAAAPPRAAPAGTRAERVRYLTRPAPRYWRVRECAPLETADGDQPFADHTEPLPEADETALYDPRLPPLLTAGEWQNLWDQLPPSRHPGRSLDVLACVPRLARAEPLRRLPRRPRRGFNRALALVLERTAALRPAWDEMAAAERSLRTLLGDELQGFHLPGGTAGPWLSLDGPGLFAPDAITAGALVVLIGTFGALETAEIGADWRALLQRLQAAGHDLLLAPLCPLRGTALRAAPLDPAPPGSDRASAAEALDALLCALSRTWLPDRRRLRVLRQAIPTASLHTELCVYNHPEVARDAFRLCLWPDYLKARLRRFQRLPDALRRPLKRAIAVSSAGLDPNAREVERLQAELTRPGPPERYRRLVRQAREAAASLGGDGGMRLAQFSSMLPVIELLRPECRRALDTFWDIQVAKMTALGDSL